MNRAGLTTTPGSSPATYAGTRCGVDIGATKWLVAAGEPAAPRVLGSGRTAGPHETLEAIGAVLRRSSPDDLVCAFAGSWMTDGTVRRWPNRPGWEGFALQAALEGCVGSAVRLVDDGISAGWGEVAAGRVDPNASFLCVSVGTGVASGLFVDGAARSSSGPSAFSLGHVRTGFDIGCVCGRRGCVQALLCGPQARRKDPVVLHRVSEVMADVCALLGLDAVVLTGGVVRRDADFATALAALLADQCAPHGVTVISSRDPDHSAVRGALSVGG